MINKSHDLYCRVYRQTVVPAAVCDFPADVLLRAVLPVVPIQVIGVNIGLRGGEAHAAGVTLDPGVELHDDAFVSPVRRDKRRRRLDRGIAHGDEDTRTDGKF